MKTWDEIIGLTSGYLREHGVPDATVAAELLAARLLGCGRGFLSPHLGKEAGERHLDAMRRGMARLAKGEPVQYVTGMAHFCDLLIKVSPAVLIPRPETEELVQKICATIPQESPIRIWDIGTGSGCIAIALAKHFENAEVIAFDVSEDALHIAKENAENNGVQVTFVHDDVLSPKSEFFNLPVDLVVSNPPYVCDSERAAMERNVLDWEPENALFVPDDDPLLFYRQILKLAKDRLTYDGQIWFEINEAKGEEMLQLCLGMGFAKAEILTDFADKPRFLRFFS